ncbi:hypothetical protein FB45DRAFT_948136 [Roridomyces roridus]|uniref:Uncharacterized protein n=1 Tax=Roridomyces roridus TaxID=1738132 RepID=A0AAD7B0Z4_9AGAR|nr:hypothetical protein FB45DRAFT_948136 [Roridomyces roridus]
MKEEYGSIHFISGLNEEYGRFYVLRKVMPGRDQLMVIEAEAVTSSTYMVPLEILNREVQVWHRKFQDGLEIIQTLLPMIQFGRTNWARLIKEKDNRGYRIRHTAKHEPTISDIPPWCPLVDERDVKTTAWRNAEDRDGLWDGNKVDVFLAWDSSNAYFLWRTMVAYKLLMKHHLEHLAFPALAHVVRAETTDICGILTEPAYGRPVEYEDKAKVYKVISQIERAGLMYSGVQLSNILIDDKDQVRLLSLCSLQPPRTARELEFNHWTMLEDLFATLKDMRNPIPPPRQRINQLLPIPIFLPPERGPVLHVHVLLDLHLPPVYRCEEEDAQNHDVGWGVARVPRPPKAEVEVLIFDAPISPTALRLRASTTRPEPNLLHRVKLPYSTKSDKLVQELRWAQRQKRLPKVEE